MPPDARLVTAVLERATRSDPRSRTEQVHDRPWNLLNLHRLPRESMRTQFTNHHKPKEWLASPAEVARPKHGFGFRPRETRRRGTEVNEKTCCDDARARTNTRNVRCTWSHRGLHEADEAHGDLGTLRMGKARNGGQGVDDKMGPHTITTRHTCTHGHNKASPQKHTRMHTHEHTHTNTQR